MQKRQKTYLLVTSPKRLKHSSVTDRFFRLGPEVALKQLAPLGPVALDAVDGGRVMVDWRPGGYIYIYSYIYN